MTTLICRGLDIGFGFTKFTRGADADGNTLTAAFPSFATVANPPTGGDGLSAHNVVHVRVGVNTYAVGADAQDSADGSGSRMLERSFFISEEYLALARGAMADMQTGPTIHSLAIGLPLQYFNDTKLLAGLSERMQGPHPLPSLAGTSDSDRSVRVEKVTIFPQVVGSLMHHFGAASSGATTTTTALTIDAGYGTLVWLTTRGSNSQPKRSGGNMGGASRLIERIARRIDPAIANDFELMGRLDEALRLNRKAFKLRDGDVLLDQYRPMLETAVLDHVTEMLRSVGDTANIDQIILTGGGAYLYRSVVQNAFPNRMIHAPINPRFANVLGFQKLAEQVVA